MIGYTRCPYCNNSGAERLYAVDRQIECFCPECYAEWSHHPDVVQDTAYERFTYESYGEG